MTEEKIALRFEQARDALKAVDKQAHGAKKLIIKDLAKDLEEWLPLHTIAEEIATRMDGKISKSVVYGALDDRYKSVERSKAQKKAKAKKKENLSPKSDLAPANPSASTPPRQVVAATTDGASVVTPESTTPPVVGTVPDRTATYTEKLTFKIKELSEALKAALEENKTLKGAINKNIDAKLGKALGVGEDSDLTNEYIHSLKQKIKEKDARIQYLEEPYDFPFVVQVGGLKVHQMIRARPANKEIAKVTVDEDKLPREVFA